jgi:hypothetical protein
MNGFLLPFLDYINYFVLAEFKGCYTNYDKNDN